MADDNRDDDVRLRREPSGFPEWLIVFGVCVGLLLIAGGGAAYLRYGGQPVVHLLVSVGLGLVLALFGTQAKVDYRHYTVAGGGAVGLIFFILLQRYVPAPGVPCDVTWGTLKNVRGSFPPGTTIVIMDQGNQLLGALAGGNALYRFIVKGNRLLDSEPDLAIKEGDTSPLLPFRLRSDLLNEYVGKRQDLDLRYDGNRQQIIDKTTGGIVGTLLGPSGASQPPVASFTIPNLVREAFASDPPVTTLLETFTKGDLRYRIEARDAIIRAGARALGPLVGVLRGHSDAATQADVLSMMIAIFQADPMARARAVELLQPGDLANLTALLGDDDRNVRWIATLFFETLQDPEAVVPLQDAALRGRSATQRFNALYALESLLSTISPERANAVVATVRQAAAMEPDDKVKKSMEGFDTPRYHLVVASYSSKTDAIERAEKLRNTGTYPDAAAYRLRSSDLFVTTVGASRLRDTRQEKITAMGKGVAQADAWPTTDTAFLRRVFP